MKTRWTWLSGQPVEAIEIVQDGDSLEVNVLPASIEVPGPATQAVSIPSVWYDTGPQPECTVTTTADIAPDTSTLTAEALPAAEATPMPPALSDAAEASCEAETYSLSERIGMGTVRGGKMGIFAAVGEAAAYGLDNIANIGLPPGTGVAVGCVLYAVNKALVPKNGGIL